MKLSHYLPLLILISSFTVFAQVTEKKPEQLQEVVISKQKKAIEQKADRTIFDFAGQAQLSSGSVLEGLKKLPGLLISDVAGMLYQGKQLDVFLDARPLNISSNELNAFLEGMPANAVEKIEIITQPGAEFPATSGGAIINIITSKSAKSYLSATYTSSTNFTNYDKLRARLSNSLLLNAKNKYFGWQLNLGQNYRDSFQFASLVKNENNQQVTLSETNAERVPRTYFAKTALTFDFKKDRLLLNYDINANNSDAYTLGNGLGFSSNDRSKTNGVRHDAVATYQKRFVDKSKKLDFKFNLTQNRNKFDLNSIIFNAPILSNSSVQNYYNFKIDYSQPIKIFNESKISFGALTDKLTFETKNEGVTNLKYNRTTMAGYFELQTKLNKFDFILGTRAENYDISGKTATTNLVPFNQFRLFPNATVLYNFDKQVFFSINYNKKITLPSTSALNPNNTNYQNQNFNVAGNPDLQPTIFDNFELKLSAYDYAFIGYNLSSAKNQVINRVFLNGNQVSNFNVNVDEIKIHNFSFGLPLPYMLFTKGLAATMKGDINPDTMNFLYIYTGYQYHQIPNLQTKGFWTFNLSSQILLPKAVKFVTNFSTSTTGGNYFYFVAQRPFYQSLDVSLSKKFLKNQLSVSVNVDDILNMNRQEIIPVGTALTVSNRSDTRRFGFTVTYKIPTRNTLAKEDPNNLNKDKKEEATPIVN